MLDDFLQERQIRRALKAVARQRVAMVLQPENVLVVERSTPDEEWFELGVLTCQIRGWVEVLHENLPTGTVKFQGNDPKFPQEMKAKTHYRLTEGGWAILNRSHAWVLATFIVSAIGLVVALASLAVAWLALPQSVESVPKKKVTANQSLVPTRVGKPPLAAQLR
jgi:hypothetical protein